MLQGKWKTQVLYEFCIYDQVRFGQLKKDLPGLTNTMLTNTPRALQADGLLFPHQLKAPPPHADDGITDSRKELPGDGGM